jgi:hypothetical protein
LTRPADLDLPFLQVTPPVRDTIPANREISLRVEAGGEFKAVDRQSDPERRAAHRLEFAMRAYLGKRTAEARELCTTIVAEFPQTQAGREAKQLLLLIGN